LNQRAVTSYWEAVNSNFQGAPLLPPGAGCNPANLTQVAPCSIAGGAAFYQAAETGYNAQALFTAAGVIKNGLYGQPNLWQTARHIRLGATFTW
jgi:hypothetical protein